LFLFYHATGVCEKVFRKGGLNKKEPTPPGADSFGSTAFVDVFHQQISILLLVKNTQQRQKSV